jgi:predicted lipoprotein
MATSATQSAHAARSRRRKLIAGGALVVFLGAMAFDTAVVRIGSEADLRQQAFDPDRFGRAEFPRIRDKVIERAPDAVTLAEKLAADKTAAVETYGTTGGTFPVMPVHVTGTVGEGKSGIFEVNVPGLPEGTVVRVQTGPAINGTELRDAPGDIAFGAFTNQIEYQDAGAGINRAMAAEVLADLDREALPGQTISVTGAFTLINPKNWLITPVALELGR